MADPITNASLARLSDADFEVAPGEPDVRGWDVVLGSDDVVGKVDDLIIDRSAGKVRYLDVDLDREATGLDKDRHVLVPIEDAQLDTGEEEVVLNRMSRSSLVNLPEYQEGKAFAREYDDTYRSHVGSGPESKRITRSAEELRIGKRMEQKGEVRVSKHVETEHVRQSVPLRGEEVHVERRPVERAVGSAEFRDEEIVIPVREEEAIVEKRPVVKEEVVISKEPVTRERTVEADVRREEFDVEPSSDDIRVKDDMKGRGRE
jgi:uncharacterized protein (TIGR02271 family)